LEKYDICTQYIALTPRRWCNSACYCVERDLGNRTLLIHLATLASLVQVCLKEEGDSNSSYGRRIARQAYAATQQQHSSSSNNNKKQALHARVGAWSWATGRLRNLDVTLEDARAGHSWQDAQCRHL